MSERIEWIDGVKGFACIAVVCHHFLLAFYLASYSGDTGISHIEGNIDVLMAQSPMAFVLNGNYMVTIFCILSGFITSIQIMELFDKEKISEIMLKRYPRLMLPIIPVMICVYIMLQAGVFKHLEVAAITKSWWLGSYYLEPMSFGQCVKSVFVDMWLVSDSRISNAYWMMNELLKGSFVTIILSCISWNKNRKIGFVYIVCILFGILAQGYLLVFILSVVLAYMYKEHITVSPVVGVIMLTLGIFLGGYPSGVVPTNIYRFFDISFGSNVTYIFWHILAAFFTIYAISNLTYVKKMFCKKVFLFLGKISYAIYLIHIPILFSVVVIIFSACISCGISYNSSALVAFAILIGCVVMGGYLYYKIVEVNCNKVIKKVSSYLNKHIANR